MIKRVFPSLTGLFSLTNETLDFILLGKVDVCQQLDSAYRQNIKKQNEQVAKNLYKQPATIVKAGALAHVLKDNKFIFWLPAVFNKLMPHVDILYNQLQLTLKPMLTTSSWLWINREL